jgi:hypothetical protein
MTDNTEHDLHFDIQYGYWFNLKCERFYRHLDLLLNIAQLLGGSGAVLSVFGGYSDWLAAVGVLLATTSALSLLMQPAIKAGQHSAVKSQFIRLLASRKIQPAAATETTIATLRADAPAGLSLLEQPAYNAAVQAIGRQDACVTLTRAESAFNRFT